MNNFIDIEDLYFIQENEFIWTTADRILFMWLWFTQKPEYLKLSHRSLIHNFQK